MKSKKQKAFTLIELLIVVGIVISIAGGVFLMIGKRLERAAIDVEDAQLDAIAADIKNSWESEDFGEINIAALSGSIPTTTTPTAFSASTSANYTNTLTSSWFAKVARQRGIPVTYGVAPTRANQPELAKIAYNDYGNPRILIAAPAETDRQRFLLLSLAAPTYQLQLPAYDSGAAFFDAIFGTDWNTIINGVPADWTARLTSAQLAAWNSSNNGTKLFKLRVRKITINKHRLNVTNSNPTQSLIVRTDGGQTIYTLLPSTTLVTSPIFEGRQVQVFLNSTSNPVQQTFTVRRRTDVTYQ